MANEEQVTLDPKAELWPGGPTNGQIEEWKRMYDNGVYATQLDDEHIYVWRTLKRMEWKGIMRAEAPDSTYHQERIAESCVLWPLDYRMTSASGPAGAPTVLAEQILQASGFNPNANAIKL